MFARDSYVNMLAKWQDKHVIKVATGMRRVGKSTVFMLYIKYLHSVGISDSNIIYINLEDMANEQLCEYHNLHRYILDKVNNNERFYIFIDEIQQCSGFERTIDSLFLNENFDIYLTGSNAYFLSGELATYLSGRYVMIHILPLSFDEYLTFCGFDKNAVSADTLSRIFGLYLYKGQLPYIPFLQDDEQTLQGYLEGVYNTVIMKDIAARCDITDINLLNRIVRTMVSNIGSPISVKRITDTLISSGRKISGNTVQRYVQALCDSYIFYEVPRFDIRGNECLKTNGKYYLVDTGLRQIMFGDKNDDFGHIVENIIYLELRRRYNEVYIGKYDDNEIDFVVRSDDGVEYYQICSAIVDEQTRERELSPLKMIRDNYPKYILTLDNIHFGNFGGIQHFNIIQWLLNNP
ncbi:MAG: ATP-binding protein [Spirochaetales bacterium]|nr:ATP-binding protein [Spirochaetales bacterium]